jgi:hypothetical protein
MKKLIVVIGVLLIIAAIAFARPPKSDYQWTGNVLEADGDHLVVQKGNDKWEFALDKDTEGAADVKVGAKVTVYYVMKATSIEVKGEPKKAEPKAKAAPKKK